jgi:hypothetical protein
LRTGFFPVAHFIVIPGMLAEPGHFSAGSLCSPYQAIGLLRGMAIYQFGENMMLLILRHAWKHLQVPQQRLEIRYLNSGFLTTNRRSRTPKKQGAHRSYPLVPCDRHSGAASGRSHNGSHPNTWPQSKNVAVSRGR